jgi:hypothetical protein
LTVDSKKVSKRSVKRGAKERAKMAITVGKYHLMERNRRGKTVYYYWYNDRGKQIQKACGYKCDDKRSAVAFLEQLLKDDLTEAKRRSALKPPSMAVPRPLSAISKSVSDSPQPITLTG